MSLLSLAGLQDLPLFVVCVSVAALAVLLFLLVELLRSYPLGFLGLVCIVGGCVLAFLEERIALAILWVLFAVVVLVCSAMHLYKNIRGAFWWSIGAIIGLILAPIFTANKIGFEVETIKSLIIPLAVFLVIGLVGGILVPRLMFRKRPNERKHLTNTDPIIGKKILITKDSEGEFPARGVLGDVDWAIKPLFPYEHFKAGDLVKVNKIEGVTLVCLRDGKDLRSEMRAQRAAENEEARAKYEAKRQEHIAKKLAKQNAKVAAKNAQKDEKPIKERKTVTAKEKVVSKKSDIANIITAIVLVILCAFVVFVSIKFKDTFYPTGTLICGGIILIYIFALFTYKLLKGHTVQYVERVIIKEVPVEVEKKVVVKEVVVEAPKKVEAPAPKQPEPKEKAEFVPFAVRMKKADPEVKAAYNELKSEVLSYGIKSRVSNSGDTFRLHTKEYVKMVIAGKTLKMYLALNPKDYKDSSIPHDDASKMSAHKETPFVFKVKSPLAIRRAKALIAECAKKDGLVQGEVVAHNHAKDVK